MTAKVPDMAKEADILLRNLDPMTAARPRGGRSRGLIQVAVDENFVDTALWTRIDSLQ